MAVHRFDSLARLLVDRPSRRSLVHLVGGLLAATTTLNAPSIAAKNKKKNKGKKKSTLCLNGQTIEASRKQKKKLLKQGASNGACPSSPSPPPPPTICQPSCPANTCGGEDGCGGVCVCNAGSGCFSGACHPCDVSCTGSSIECGQALQNRIPAGGAIRICPGVYQRSFTIGVNVVLIGTGDGQNPASSTILGSNGGGRVMNIASGVDVTLQQLRITGGSSTGDGGGIRSEGKTTLIDCTVSNNKASSKGGGIFVPVATTNSLILTNCEVTGNEAVGGVGGGIAFESTTQLLQLNGCLVSENSSGSGGGGIYNDGPADINGTEVRANEATGFGGGLFNFGFVTLDPGCRVTANTGSSGGGIYNEGTVVPAGAQITGNTGGNCAGDPVTPASACVG